MSESYDLIRLEWARKIEHCKQSGKSIKSWCQENKVVYTTFLGWRNRLKIAQDLDNPITPSTRQFIELKNEPKTSPGFSLECEGVLIHLQAEFDAQLLKKCLAVLRGASC